MSRIVDRFAWIPARLRSALEPSANPHETRGASVVRPIVFGATDGEKWRLKPGRSIVGKLAFLLPN